MPDAPLVVVMGVSGSGKSTIGPLLAHRLGVAFVDGDDVHTDAARARMAEGHPLDDAARHPWLDRLREVLAAHTTDGLVVACSALTDAYRQRLSAGLANVVFVALVAPAPVLEARLEHRPDHFAGPELLSSQLDTLELDPHVAVIDNTGSVEMVTDAAEVAVRARVGPGGA